MVTMESIAARKPDLLLSLCRTRNEYKESPAWSAVKAVREDRILDRRAIDWNAITHQGPRIVDGIETLEKLIRSLMS
jgi:ABC-type Fe3+-hydroxamate transport system substrate-binding protein